MKRSVPTLLFLVFLAVYAWQKYAAAAPATFQQAYAVNVAILVTLTAILPYIVARLFIRATHGGVRLVSAALMPGLLSAMGFAIFFFVFIKPNYAQVELWPVVQRALTPGVALGLILTVPLLLHRD